MRLAPALLLCSAAAAMMAGAAQPALAESAEAQLRRVLDTVAEGRLNAALGDLERLIERYPNFRLAHLMRGDLLLARAGPIKVIEASFDQDYRSNNPSQRARKRQYWVEHGGSWKIAYENTAGGQKLRLPESFKSATKGARS